MSRIARTAKMETWKLSAPKARTDRKGAVASATWRVVAASGLEGATLRAIAREAGFTTGVLMHHFRNKEELFIFALDQMFERAELELTEALHQTNPIEGFREFLFHYLTLTKNSERQARSWLNFVGRALWDKAFLREYRRRYPRFRALIRRVLRAAVRAGIVRRDTSVNMEADTLFALLDGITMHALLEPGRFPPAHQRALIDCYLARLVERASRNAVVAVEVPANGASKSRRVARSADVSRQE
jgi:TetR/AcrR family transcriptional regulator, transcriptional repressor of bet genes